MTAVVGGAAAGRGLAGTEGAAGRLITRMDSSSSAGKADGKLQPPIGLAGNADRVAGTEGTTNTFYGVNAGANTAWDGNFNSFFGAGAGYHNTTADENSFFGNSAGFYNTTGYDNSFFGDTAGYYNTIGYQNCFFGHYAGAFNTTGNVNSFFGMDAGYHNTTGYNNSFFGKAAGYSNTTGFGNAFFGLETGYNNTTATQNSFFGACAGHANSTGANNAFFGRGAGYSSDAADNSFFGHEAGYNNTSGTSNSFFGRNAGASNTTEHNNSLLGAYSDGQAGITNATAIGYRAKVTQSNSLVLGSIAGVNSAPEYTKVGIGTSAPLYAVEVVRNGINAAVVTRRADGATNFMNATASYAQFGAVTNHPVRILVNSAWKASFNSDGSVNMSNGASLTAGGVWTNASSIELKENIQQLNSDEAMDALKQLNPVKFSYKADGTERHVGFIAEEAPELVASKDKKGISPMDVVAVLTKVVQEQARIVEEQQKAIMELQDKVAALERKH